MIKLPIDSSIPEILQKFKQNRNLILMASPGSGKTTRLPPALVSDGYQKIVVLVPKRIAAVSAADRIATEMGWQLGQDVGYHVRFEPVFSDRTKLLFMTEGVFVKKAQDQNFWKDIDVLIFDEFHERSSFADISLGLALEKQILEEHLKIVVMSATLNADALKNYLPENVVVEINQPPFPLKIQYSQRPQRLICDNEFFINLTQTASEAWAQSQKDILVFLPGFGEIRKAETALAKKFSAVPIDILHGSVKLSEQKRILAPQAQRRFVLATDIAESSLTLPSVDAVIDSGLKKSATIDPKLGFNKLNTHRISLFSATQRAGRAARIGPGVCFKLWHQSDERSMPEQIKPEILRSDLYEEILTLKSSGVEDIVNFSWLERPSKTHIELALNQLRKWMILNESLQLTTLGKQIQQLPLDIPQALLFYSLSEKGVQKEASHFIAALETADLDRIFEQLDMSTTSDLEKLFAAELSPQGQKIKLQLQAFRFQTKKPVASFREALIQTCFQVFPHRIAQKKSDGEAVSSLGRGLVFAKGLQARKSDYSIVFSGFNVSDSKTEIDFAIGLSKAEFLEYSAANVEQEIDYIVDLEQRRCFRIQTKKVGLFILSEGTKTPLSKEDEKKKWPQILNENQEQLFAAHSDWSRFDARIGFLQKKKTELGYSDEDFAFIDELKPDLIHDLGQSTSSLEDFLNYPLQSLIDLKSQEKIVSALQQLPDAYTMPTGRRAQVDYLSDNAPKISVKIQDVYGWKKTPLILGLPLTLELLAPSMRPTQITQNLELFWQKSYFEVRKELKARYPRHPWPDDPANYIHEKVKK